MYEHVRTLYPLCRSITGDGLRQTLDRIAQEVTLSVREVPSGTRVLDWTVPKEWNIRDAYIKDSRGHRVVDFKDHNLHVVSYSVPLHLRMSLSELRPHLHSLPEHPDWIPYRTSYYKENWGFCLTQKQLEQMTEEEYEVCIDSSFSNGHLTYGECYIPGTTSEEILVSCHCCHPSLCNDNLSGIVSATYLARYLADKAPWRYSYRFLFVPGTIGSITWLALNEDRVGNIRHGLVLTGVGDAGGLSYKRSRRGNAEVDRITEYVLAHSGKPFKVVDFSPFGYDERQYCSPGFNLPVGCLMRTPHGKYPQYHTSADNLEFVKPDSLADTFETCLAVFSMLEQNRCFINLKPKGEPQLGKRGLYSSIGGRDIGSSELAMLWVLSMSDGSTDLLHIAERSGLEFDLISGAAAALAARGLLAEKQFPGSAAAGSDTRGHGG